MNQYLAAAACFGAGAITQVVTQHQALTTCKILKTLPRGNLNTTDTYVPTGRGLGWGTLAAMLILWM